MCCVLLPPILRPSRIQQWPPQPVWGSPPISGSLTDLLWRCFSAAHEGSGVRRTAHHVTSITLHVYNYTHMYTHVHTHIHTQACTCTCTHTTRTHARTHTSSSDSAASNIDMSAPAMKHPGLEEMRTMLFDAGFSKASRIAPINSSLNS